MCEVTVDIERLKKYRLFFGGLHKLSDDCLQQMVGQALARVQQDGVEKNHVYYSLLITYALGSVLSSQGQLYGLGGLPPSTIHSESIDGATRTYSFPHASKSYEQQYARLLKSVLSLGYLLA